MTQIGFVGLGPATLAGTESGALGGARVSEEFNAVALRAAARA